MQVTSLTIEVTQLKKQALITTIYRNTYYKTEIFNSMYKS